MKNAEIAEATSWRVSSFDDTTRVAREEARNRSVDKKLRAIASLQPDQIKFFTDVEFPRIHCRATLLNFSSPKIVKM